MLEGSFKYLEVSFDGVLSKHSMVFFKGVCEVCGAVMTIYGTAALEGIYD